MAMIHPVRDEVLERLWYLEETGRSARTPDDLHLSIPEEHVTEALQMLVEESAIRRDGELRLLPAGQVRARGIVRRHRLAEILFNQVLELPLRDAEQSACEFEHMLAEHVVNRVCAFLGHPPKCPHGKSIPQGECCRTFGRAVEPLIIRLCDLRVGGTAVIAFIAPKIPSRITRLANLGIAPGTSVRLLQRQPSAVIQSGETTVAIEDEISREIYVRPA